MKALCVPLTGIVRESMLSVQVLRGIAEAVELAGVPRGQLFRAANFDAALLERPDASVTRADAYRLCEVAIGLTGDPALGLHWAERLSVTTFNPLSNLMAHSATLRQGLESLQKFHRLLVDEPSFHLLEHGDVVTLRYVRLAAESLAIQRFSSELFVTGIFRMIRVLNPQAQLRRVSFEYAAPEYHAEYERVFERAVQFNQPFTGVEFDRALMDATSPYKDDDVYEALRAIAERRILGVERRAPYSLLVRERLVRQGPARPTDMNSVARSLGLSARSLRRRLAAEGKPYHSVVNEALAIIAKHYLRNRQLRIQEIAYEMGFTDTSAFHRAFKRWTGMTPSEVREGRLKCAAPLIGEPTGRAHKAPEPEPQRRMA